MPLKTPGGEEPIDYWREVVRRGVMALGFALQGQAEITAELIAPQEGPVQRAAYAALEMHKLIGLESGTAVHAARDALARELVRGPASRELAIYQGLLIERLWREVQPLPGPGLSGLAYPHLD